MRSILTAAAIAGLAAVLLSLPLRSPDDAFFHAGTVALGALLAGAVLALVARTAGPAHARRAVVIAALVLFALAFAGAVAGESMLQRTIAFVVPLAGVVLGGTVLLTPLLERAPALPAWGPVVAIAITAAAGLGLAGRGDAASGHLSLPEQTGAAASVTPPPTGTATPATRSFRAPADLRGVTFAVGEGSEATFTVREKLANLPAPNDAVERTSALSGEIHLDGQPSTVTIDLRRLTSDQPRRDNFAQQSLFRSRPTATFTVPAITNLPAPYAAGDTVKQQVAGTVQIGGVSAPLTFEVEARLDGEVLRILGRTSFHWADLQLTAPNTPTVQVQDEVRVEVLLVARPQ